MNLILSDVEETIMIVDPEAAEHGQSVVNVRVTAYWMAIEVYRRYTHRLRNGRWICFLLEGMVLFWYAACSVL